MKNLFLLILMTVSMNMAATNNPTPTTKSVDITKSAVKWEGKKVTGKHEGNIMLKSGSLMFDNDQLVGGEFAIDMNSITCTDLQGGGASKLVGHLKSDDFFGVETHQTATLKITSTKPLLKPNKYQINADITIKGITQPITFEATILENQATADLTIDRTKFDVKYGSGSIFDGLGDKMIYDNFNLNLNLVF